MKLVLMLITIFSTGATYAQTFKCSNHAEWADDRKFSAQIELIMLEKNRVEAKVTNLSLSESWPLPQECESPIEWSTKNLKGVVRGDKITLWLPKGKECGFMFFMVVDSDAPTLLSPKKTTDHFIEEPFLASCKII